MEVRVVVIPDDEIGGDGLYELSINGVFQFRIGNYLNECPGDAYLCRDLGFVYDIPNLMKQAYNAGKTGEEFILTKEVNNDN